jgi:hypothetical protein
VATLVCALLLPLGAAACGGADTTQDTTQDPIEEDTGSPETEDTDATEDPDDPSDPVAVELPGLPIGGNALVVSETLQCVDVGWTSPPDLPDWVAITVTGVQFEPSDGFALSDETCEGGAPPCLDSDFQLTTSERCYVAVTFTGPTLESERSLSFSSGEISCEPDRVAECEAFRDEVTTAGPQSIPLDPAPSEFETDDGTDETDDGTESNEG